MGEERLRRAVEHVLNHGVEIPFRDLVIQSRYPPIGEPHEVEKGHAPDDLSIVATAGRKLGQILAEPNPRGGDLGSRLPDLQADVGQQGGAVANGELECLLDRLPLYQDLEVLAFNDVERFIDGQLDRAHGTRQRHDQENQGHEGGPKRLVFAPR